MIGPLDICVPVHNALPFVQRCLESIAETTSVPYRLIVHDDASEPATADWLREWAPRRLGGEVILVRSPKQVWFTSSVNRCLAFVRGGWVLILNSDVVLQDDQWFKKCLAAWGDHVGLLGQIDHACFEGPPIFQESKVQGHFWFTHIDRIRRVGQLRETEPKEVHICSDDAWCAAFRKHGFTNYSLTSIKLRHGWDDTPFEAGGASWSRDLNRLPRWIDVVHARATPPVLVYTNDDDTLAMVQGGALSAMVGSSVAQRASRVRTRNPRPRRRQRRAYKATVRRR